MVAESRGAEALVPLNPSVHPPLRSIVVCCINKKYIIIFFNYENYYNWFESDFLCKKSRLSLKFETGKINTKYLKSTFNCVY